MYDFILGPVDTDSISICKQDFSEFSKEEQYKLIAEINDILPELIKYEHDGYFPKIIITAAKNYILKDENSKITYKGSSFKDSKKEPALKNFMKDIINEILNETFDYLSVYNRYRDEILHITDITPWCSKKTITMKVLEGTRLNETNIADAIEETEYVEGDKVHTFYLPDDTLCLKENFKGEYNKRRLLKRLYDTAKIFKNIIDINEFKNYSLKKNLKELGVE